MTLTIKNADNLLLEVIEKIIKLSPNSYELTKTHEETNKNHLAYAKEVQKIIDQVESGEMETYTLEESKIYLDEEIKKIKAQHASN